MNQIINLQIPISINIRNQALKTAKSMGFSSLQESLRIILHQMAIGSFAINIEPKPVVLSAKNNRRYTKMIDDIESGREKTIGGFKSTKDMIKYLDDHS
jgi:hypothetical protein